MYFLSVPFAAFKARYLFLFSFICILPAIALHAQSNDLYTIKHFTNENGLAQNSINDIALDKNGFLWIATHGGISRYDGRHFKLYSSSNTVFRGDRLNLITIGHSGNIYIRDINGNNDIYTISSDYNVIADTSLYQQAPVFFARQNEPVILSVPADCPDREHRVWELNSRLGTIKSSFESTSVNEHQVYYCYDKKIELFDNRTGLIKKCAALTVPLRTTTVIGDIFLGFDTANRCMAIRNGRLLNTLPVTAGFLTLLNDLQKKPQRNIQIFRNNLTGTLMEDHDNIYLIRNKNGLLDATLLFANINFGQINTSMLYDEVNRTLFIGTYTNGLYIVKKKAFRTINFDKKNTVNNNIYAQLQLNSHTVINRHVSYDPLTGATKPMPPGLPLTAFYKSADHKVWYATSSHIMVCDTLLQPLATIPFRDDKTENIVGCFMEDAAKRVWFSSYNSLGYIKDGLPFYKIFHSAFFFKNKIAVLFLFNKETIWIGHANGITAYHINGDKVDPVVQLQGNDIRSIYRARDSSIWVSTYGRGIYKYLNGQFIKMPVDANRHLLFAHSFNEDNNGFFWIPTNNGLFQCKKEDLDHYAADRHDNSIYYYYYKDCGIYTNEFNGGSNPMSVFYKHLLLLPTINGVVSFAPDSLQPDLPNKNILVENVQVDDVQTGLQDHFTLPPGFERLELNVTAPYIGEPVNNILEYNLSGNGNIWYPVSAEGLIVYNQLPYGNYVLSIRKRLGFGQNNYAYRRIHFTVRPYWYQTYWFFAIVILLLTAFVYYMVRLRIMVLEKRTRTLEKLVTERTSTLYDTVNELHVSEQHLSTINTVQEKAIAMILHDIQSPLHYLTISANYFNKRVKGLPEEELVAYAESLFQSTAEINNLTNDLLQWLIYNHNNLAVQTEPIAVHILLQEVESLYAGIARLNGNTLLLVQDEPVTVYSDRNKLKLIIRNLADNANKNCHNGEIRLSCYADEKNGSVNIVITDTGRGMSAAEVTALLEQPQQPQATFKNGKLGFTLIRDFLNVLGGHIAIESTPGKGTRVMVCLPAKPAPATSTH